MNNDNQRNSIRRQGTRAPKPVTIYIGNMAYSKDEGKIKRLFNKFGKVLSVKLILDTKTNKSKGIAFVQMTNPVAAEEAIKSLNGKEVDGRTLKVSVALEREEFQQKNINAKAKASRVIREEMNFETTKPKTKRTKKGAGLNELFDYLGNKK
ncbi:MAG: hypothetical protein GY909_18120 [Oligoflexia bacterium]|nr:hypothetical protein [Oligoflexia bacterium]